MPEQAGPAWCIRWSYEFLLSVYYVLMLFLYTGTFSNFVVHVGRLQLLRGTRFGLSSDPSFSLQYLSWFLMAGIVFIVLRILGQIRPLRTILCQLVGSAVFLVPLVGMMPVWATKPTWWSWLWVAGAIATVAALLYANRSRPATAAFLAATALLHFGLWGFVYFRNVGLVGVIDTVVEMVFLPLVGSLVWGLYVWLVAQPSPTQ